MTHNFKKFPELTNRQLQLYYWDSPHQQITEDFRAKVIRVIDGDTIRVETNFRDFDFPVRLARIAAPELDEEKGKESQNWLENKLLGEEIDIIINPRKRVGKWGRLIGEIIHIGININNESMDKGYSTSIKNIKNYLIPDASELFKVKRWV